MAIELIKPNWPAPANVQAFTTTRIGGVSQPPFDSLNLATHVNDNPQAVRVNRQIVAKRLPAEPVWLNQTHSNQIACLDDDKDFSQPFDASISSQNNRVCAVMTADCLPLLISDEKGSVAAAVHAGWQGLANGIIAKTINKIVSRYGVKSSELLVWLGPAISQQYFEIGTEVKIKLQHSMVKRAEEAFISGEKADKWFADVYQIARQQLFDVDVTQVFGGEYCTYGDETKFYSHRRATHQNLSSTGRMVSVVCINHTNE